MEDGKMKDIILDYLKKQSEVDIGLKNNFDEKYINDCVDYICSQARKEIKGSSGYIADEVVYKWARDYFVDEIYKNKTEKKNESEKVQPEEKKNEPEKQEEKIIEKEQKKKTLKKVEKKVSVLSEKNTDDLYQLELFDFGDE